MTVFENIVKPMLNGLFRYFTPTKPTVGASGGLKMVVGYTQEPQKNVPLYANPMLNGRNALE